MRTCIKSYVKDGQLIVEGEYFAGEFGSDNKDRWKILFGKDTCAIRLSFALNHAGYNIPEFKTINGRITWSSNVFPNFEYILGAKEMGAYLLNTLGSPSIKSNGPIVSKEGVDEFIKKFEGIENYGGIIFLDSLNSKSYGAPGHVDLVFSDNKQRPRMYSRDVDLSNYLLDRNGDQIIYWTEMVIGGALNPMLNLKFMYGY